MLGRPTGSGESGQPQGHQGGEEGDRPQAVERIGVLTIARYRKDDGRKLILYARAQDEHR
jgi:hypothetical protein